MLNIESGTNVLGKYEDDSTWYEAEFLKYDKDMEYGKYICLTCSNDGKVVECFDKIKEID